MASEFVTLVFGIITAAIFKSKFAIWYLGPLVLKLIALVAQVKRGTGEQSDEPDTPVLCQTEDCSDGYF
jgi:hypothetical protein